MLAAAGIVPDGGGSALAPPPPLSPASERLRLLDAVAVACAALAADRPLVVALHDLQWAEPATWDILVHLTRWLGDAPVLLLAVREEALHGGGTAARAVAELNRQRVLLHLPLRRLDAAEVRRLTADLLGGEPSAPLTELVFAHGEGNPFFAEEVEAALGPARDAGIIVGTGEGWSFSHDTVRETVYDDAGPARRRLYAAAARALEAEGGPADFHRLAAVACHLRLADEPAKGADAALPAAAAATAIHALAEAFAYVRTGRELRKRAEAAQPPNERRAAARLTHGAAALAAGDPALTAEVCASLSNHHYFTGELRAADEYAQRRLELARTAGDPFALRHAHTWLALIAVSFGHWERVQALLREAESLLARLDSPEPRAFHMMIGSHLLIRLGRLEEALARAAEAVAVFARVDPATAVWPCGTQACRRCCACGSGGRRSATSSPRRSGWPRCRRWPCRRAPPAR